jgi:A/G-specific adenine glycosylase
LISPPPFRASLLAWYARVRRDLPWRESSDFYRVWISEIMLQQTRVEAVIPYYRRFLGRFPDIASLAAAPEQDVLTAWSGLGYYSRARNLQRAAQNIVAGGLPETYEQLLKLPGAGPYTAAAIASIALNLPHAAVDGNVIRVISRLTNDPSEISSPAARRRFAAHAQLLLDPQRPGDFNQAMMELGATICVPAAPRCAECPVSECCAARAAGTARELPVKLRPAKTRHVPLHLLVLERASSIFLLQRNQTERRLAGFWELPEKSLLPGIRTRLTGEFSHQIVNDRFRIKVWRAAPPEELPAGRWFGLEEARSVPLTTITRKALEASNLFRVSRADGPTS